MNLINRNERSTNSNETMCRVYVQGGTLMPLMPLMPLFGQEGSPESRPYWTHSNHTSESDIPKL